MAELDHASAPALSDQHVAAHRDELGLIEALAHQRAALASPNDQAQLDQAELRFLHRQASRPGSAVELQEAVQAAERARLVQEQRALLATDPGSAVALFELVDLRAALRAQGMQAEANDVAVEIERRIGLVAHDAMLVEEARERWVSLSTEEEDLRLRHRVHLLTAHAEVLAKLEQRRREPTLRRLARRMRTAANDRVLALRIERLLSRRGAVVLEHVSLGLLLVLFVLLAIEALVPLAPSTALVLLGVDSAICLFFVGEFLFKLALTPARPSWFARNALVDLLPALPAALAFVSIPVVATPKELPIVRVLRLLRIASFARYVQALRPMLQLWRLLLFMVRGLDRLVQRFSPFLNRNLVFFGPEGSLTTSDPALRTQRQCFDALRREHVLLDELPAAPRIPALLARAQGLAQRLGSARPAPGQNDSGVVARDLPVEAVIEMLYALRPEELAVVLPRADLLALDRLARLINTRPIRWLPFVRRLCSHQVADTPAERVVKLGYRVAARLEAWRERLLFFADLHGILTGPQILDRIATALVKATQRPAVRMLLFGGLFLVVRWLVGEHSAAGEFLRRFVATPLLVLGSVCLVLLGLGRWLKRLAGEAADSLRRTSEAHFLRLLRITKQQGVDRDLGFLAARVFGIELGPAAASTLQHEVRCLSDGRLAAAGLAPPLLEREVNRVGLLYLHWLQGAVLHEDDVQTTEQLLANLSLENIRSDYLAEGKGARKRLRRLTLDEGSMFRGPYLWFRCITESVALETAKRVLDYNRHCVPVQHADHAGMTAWLERRRGEQMGRPLERVPPVDQGGAFAGTELHALDFLLPDHRREAQLERLFGGELVRQMRADRQQMIREIFGIRPLAQLPRSRRIVNFYTLYGQRFSHGRILLLPWWWLLLIGRGLSQLVRRTTDIVAEILAPETARRRRLSGRAAFSVALRKIHRMKAPGLLEAIAMRVALDPEYCGAAAAWSGPTVATAGKPEVERDLDFLQLKERDRGRLRARAADVCQQAQACALALHREALGQAADPLDRALGERAITIAWLADRDRMRTLLRAEQWWQRTRAGLVAARASRTGGWLRGLLQALTRRGASHAVDRWLATNFPHEPKGVRRALKARWPHDRELRTTVTAWLALPAGVTPRQRGLELARAAFAARSDVNRDLLALRAVQTLTVLDVRAYRMLVFNLGGYAEDGESPELATALP